MIRAVVGANWGNEGKGKMTDLFSCESDIVVRYQGGAGVGHTVINEYGKFALYLLPSGVFHKDVTNVISQGVAFDIPQFFAELDALLSRGVPHPRIMISDRARLVLPEAPAACCRAGQPSYDDGLNSSVQVCDLFEESYLRKRLNALYGDDARAEAVLCKLLEHSGRLEPMVGDVSSLLGSAVKEGKNILLEGQLGALRDPDHGIYPYTAASSTLAAYAAVSTGIPLDAIDKVYAVTMAFSTSSHSGALVSEIFGAEADSLLGQGDGEKRAGTRQRVGWFDVVATRYGCKVQGATDVVLSMLDMLGYLDRIPVCAAYDVDGKITGDFPSTPKLNRTQPVMEYLPGWKSDIRGVKSWFDLPRAAQDYVLYIEKKLGVPVSAISTGPKREDIIFRDR